MIPERQLPFLSEISANYPNEDAALAKIAALHATLSLPKPTIHVISDVHGEDKKLRHVVNNASGSLRALVDRAFGSVLSEEEKNELLNFIYYPRESYALREAKLRDGKGREFLRRTLGLEFDLLRELARHKRLDNVEELVPEEYRLLFRELLFAPQLSRSDSYLEMVFDQFLGRGSELNALRVTARVVRNLLISELIVAGDLGDRGPRIDRVIGFLMRQPHVSITWGNHDASWMAACLGHEASIATVLRVSLRYRNLSQLEEGYGITMAPLEKLAREAYGDDPAEHFHCKGHGLRDPLQMSRMQKAIAIIQFKLEGELVRRNSQFNLEHRNLLHRIDREEGTVTIDGKVHPLRDTNFPTVDWSDPYRLSAAEEACMARLRESFLESRVLWEQMLYVMRKGSMYLVRDNHLIFHACVPVDENGDFLEFPVDGEAHKGRALFDKLGSVVRRAFRNPSTSDLDLLWYLWGGPRSPWFGKDKMATFETYFIADKETHAEVKNPYFKLIHDAGFCRRILEEFGADPEAGLIVNGHVPVKIEKGESPVKNGGKAVTIDGAFSEAYGDKGYTLVLEPERTFLAQHHHFESVNDAILKGTDMIPSIKPLREFGTPRRIADTEDGSRIRDQIGILTLLLEAYRENAIIERM